MTSPSKVTVSSLKLKTVDGTGFLISADSFSEYFLHPVFLRFFFAAIAVYMLVDDDLYLRGASLWKVAAIWLGVVAIILIWLWIGFELLRFALRRGVDVTFYTPVALVPLAVVIEAGAQLADRLMTGMAFDPVPDMAESVVLNIAVFLVFDILHGHFVVPVHPHGTAFSALPPQTSGQAPSHKVHVTRRAEEPSETAAAAVAESAPAPAPAAGIPKIGPVTTVLRVGNKQLDLEDILMVRTEDHYLGIVTRTGKTLQRAKLSDLPELHASRLGMQINRSVWVAFAAISEMTENDRGQITLKLVTGDEEVVAKPRVFAFRQFYRPDAA